MAKVTQPEPMEVWDAGLYPAKVISCEDTVSTYPGSEGKPRFKWVIRAKDDTREEDDQTTDIWYYSNTTLSDHKLATFRPLCRALLPDVDLDDPAAEIDTDDMVGKRCRVLLGINEEKGRNTVDKILPWVSGSPGKAPAARRPIADEDSDDDGGNVPPDTGPKPSARQPVAAGRVPTVAERRAAAPGPDDLPF